MTTSRNNTIMSWMAYTDFLSRLRIAAGILLPLNTRTLLLYPGGRDCIGAAGVDAYVGSRLLSVRGIMKNIQKRFGVLPGLVEQGNILRIRPHQEQSSCHK